MCFGEGERRADRVRGKFGKSFVKSGKDESNSIYGSGGSEGSTDLYCRTSLAA